MVSCTTRIHFKVRLLTLSSPFYFQPHFHWLQKGEHCKSMHTGHLTTQKTAAVISRLKLEEDIVT
jgi:hypothetical protein